MAHLSNLITESLLEDIEHAVQVILIDLRPSFHYSLSTILSALKQSPLDDPTNQETLKEWSQSILNLAEIEFKSKPYKTISTLDRSFYSIAALLHAIVLVQDTTRRIEESEQNEAWIEIIRVLDKASILTGCPVLPKLFSSFSLKIQEYLETKLGHSDPFATVTVKDRSPASLKCPIQIIEGHEEMSPVRWKELLFCGMPILFKNANASWPAVTSDSGRSWSSLGRLQSLIGRHRLVPVEIGSSYLDDSWTQQLMSFGTFLEKVQDTTSAEAGTRLYLAQYDLFSAFPRLLDDISLPIPLEQGTKDGIVSECNVKMNVWIGPAGTVSPTHHDPYENLFCQVVGVKYLRLFSPDETTALYPFPSDSLLSNTSQVNVENPDLSSFPEYAKVKYVETEVYPGDMLYIPKGWWHFVKSETISVSVSFWF